MRLGELLKLHIPVNLEEIIVIEDAYTFEKLEMLERSQATSYPNALVERFYCLGKSIHVMVWAEAVDQSVPKPVFVDEYDLSVRFCPTCGVGIVIEDLNDYCPCCGQALAHTECIKNELNEEFIWIKGHYEKKKH